MKRVLIFGNSGAGKSTLATRLCQQHGLTHLDLDTIAWRPVTPPERSPLAESHKHINEFALNNEGWVIEGCYTDLLEIAAPLATEIIFMDVPVAQCIANAKSRPWEPHKYASKEEQDKNLAMLINWIQEYHTRTDTLSHMAHDAFFNNYDGKKTRLTSQRP